MPGCTKCAKEPSHLRPSNPNVARVRPSSHYRRVANLCRPNLNEVLAGQKALKQAGRRGDILRLTCSRRLIQDNREQPGPLISGRIDRDGCQVITRIRKRPKPEPTLARLLFQCELAIQ